VTAIDENIFQWINGLAGKSAALDRIMIWLANDYFIPVTISLILLAIWFIGKTRDEREGLQRSLITAFISIGSACGFVMAANHIYHHPHPFETMPELLNTTVKDIYYKIHDPSFPSNTSAVTFAAAASLWQNNRKIGLLMLIPAILMPFAKVYAGVYWPSDVVAGAILGVLTAYFIKLIMPVFEPIISRTFMIFRKLYLA
jgi:undecaprenyl-diphosphatase